MKGALDIAAKTKKVDIDSRLSLRYYYRTADNLLKQAGIYRDEGNTIDYYILLLRFSSLVSETIPEHHEYRVYPKERKEYKRKLIDVITELEKLKPEFQKQVDHYNKAFLKSAPPPSKSSPSPYYNSSSYNDTGTTRSSYSRSLPYAGVSNYEKSGDEGPRGYGDAGPRGYGDAGPDYNPPSSSQSQVNSSVDDQLKALSLNIPRPKEETLSRHSILGPYSGHVIQRPRKESAPVKVQYPSNVVGTPIEIPSFFQDWSVPAQATNSAVSASVASLDSLSEPASQSYPAPPPTLIRQPMPPPIAAPVQTMQSGLHDLHDHSQTMVAGSRPGSAQTLDDVMSKGPKHLHISTKMMDEFLRLAKANTARNVETCGVLSGSLKKGTFFVSTLIIPKQEATSDTCQTLNEEEIFDYQDKRGLFSLGWIHTHPTQTCFMSSVDLHTHYAYQIMLQEAIAIVMAPTDVRPFGIFRLTDPGGVRVIQECRERGFHPHEEPPDGSKIYDHCKHVYMNPKLQFDVVDLRA